MGSIVGSIKSSSDKGAAHSSGVEDKYHTNEHARSHRYGKKRRGRHAWQPGPGLKWKKSYTPAGVRGGRVLIIEFASKKNSDDGTRKVLSLEIDNADGLRKFYAEEENCKSSILRIFHVQNAPWAVIWLKKKFNLEGGDDIVPNDFGHFLENGKLPQQRGGKAQMSGKRGRRNMTRGEGLARLR
jgi:hypothetical protein